MNITPFMPKTNLSSIHIKDWPPAVKKIVTAVSPILTMTALFSLVTPLSLSVKVVLLSSALITKYASTAIEAEPLANPPLDIPLPRPLVMEALEPKVENQKPVPVKAHLAAIQGGITLKKTKPIEKPQVEDPSLQGILAKSMLARRHFIE